MTAFVFAIILMIVMIAIVFSIEGCCESSPADKAVIRRKFVDG